MSFITFQYSIKKKKPQMFLKQDIAFYTKSIKILNNTNQVFKIIKEKFLNFQKKNILVIYNKNLYKKDKFNQKIILVYYYKTNQFKICQHYNN